MVKSRLKKSDPECPFECGGGCNCYLGNAQIEVKGASLNKVAFGHRKELGKGKSGSPANLLLASWHLVKSLGEPTC